MKPNLRTPLLLLAIALAGCSSQIQHGLDERDANEIISVLTSRGFPARKVQEKGKKPTWAIEVDDTVATNALRVLAELKLPRPHRTTTREIASQIALIETPAAERLRQLEAQEGDIEQTLETMDGVASSAVELVVPAPPRPGMATGPSKASVLLRVHPGARERIEQQRTQLQALVAASVDGLVASEVVLMVDTVVSQVPTPEAHPQPPPLRRLALGLGVALALLALVLVAVALRLRKGDSPAAGAMAEPGPTTTGQPPRPVVNPAIRRRAA